MRKVWLLVLMVPVLMGATDMQLKYDKQARKVLDQWAATYAKQHEMVFLNSGLGGMVDGKDGLWVVSLTSGKKMDLEEGKRVAAQLTREMLGLVHQNPAFLNYCKVATIKRPDGIKDELVGFKLAFWDENVDRPLYPYLAQIRLADGKVYYHYADPETQALQEPIVESLIK